MSRITGLFRGGHKALIPYITVGYPSLEATLKVVPLLAETGADIVELGIPFSDPLADGVTIQKASFEALKNGVTVSKCLEVAKQVSRTVNIPLVFMTYFNLVFSYGGADFCRECAKSGVDGLIVPDLPPDEGGPMETACRENGLDLIYLLAPTSTDGRVRLVAQKSSGFIYLVSVTGVTGARQSLSVNLEGFIARVRRAARQPLCVGFGISTPEQAGEVARLADGVIVGSKIIQLMEKGDDFLELKRFVASLRQAIDQPPNTPTT